MASARSRSSGDPGPSDNARLSFGVELEFLVAYIPQGFIVTDTENPNIARAIQDEDENPLQVLRDAIQALPGVGHEGGVNRVFNYGDEALWNVSTDPTIQLPGGVMPQGTIYKGVTWVAVEIQSPALWTDQEESLAEVRQVCELLTNQFWTIVPNSCGLHFHVGAGGDYLSTVNLRRLAALVFAADPILVQLHPEHRKNTVWCLSSRVFSAVAQGGTAASAMLRLTTHGVIDREDEGEVIAHQRKVVVAPEFHLHPTSTANANKFTRQIPHGTLTGYPYTPAGIANNGQPSEGMFSQFPPPLDMRSSIKELTEASRRGVIESLMMSYLDDGERLAYNFDNLTEIPDFAMARSRKRTLEFRQTAGSVDASHVLAFAQTYIKLCRFAIDSDHRQFWAILNRCIEADPLGPGKQPSMTFDVFDLLASMGLNTEAADLQTLILARSLQEELEDADEENQLPDLDGLVED